jgi:hypothetical protein
MRNRGTLNLFIDAVMFLALAFIAGIGFLLKYTLPPGREKILKYGENVQLYFLGLDRHQWGSIHLIAAYVLLGLLVLHIALHWKAIVGRVRNAVPLPLLRSTLTTILILLCAACFAFAFLVVPTRKAGGDYLFRNARGSAFGKPTHLNLAEEESDGEGPARQTGEPAGVGSVGRGHASIRGSVTVADVAKIYGIPVGEVKRRLGLPADVDGAETFGRLRRIYGFTMQRVREHLEKDR